MEIKVYKICLFDGKRIHELYEECARKEGRIREAEKERNFHRIQIKRYGQDFKDLLEQIEDLKADRDQLKKEQVLLKEMYIQSEKARKHLAGRLEECMKELELCQATGESPYEKGGAQA